MVSRHDCIAQRVIGIEVICLLQSKLGKENMAEAIVARIKELGAAQRCLFVNNNSNSKIYFLCSGIEGKLLNTAIMSVLKSRLDV